MSEANKQIAIKFIHAMSNADAAGQAACITDDAITITKGFAEVSGQRNRETMMATVEAFKDIVPTGFRPTIERVIAEGNTVVVEWEGNAELSDGTPYGNQYVFIFTFRDGKICQLNEYFCTALADRTIVPLLAEKGAALAHGSS